MSNSEGGEQRRSRSSSLLGVKLWGSAPRNPEELHPYGEGRVVTGGLPAGRATLRPPFHSAVTSAQGEGLQLWGEVTDAHGGPKSLVCPLVSWPSMCLHPST